MAKTQKSKWTESQIKKHIERIQEATEKQKRESKHQHFTMISPEEIREKFKRINSPMIASYGWSGSTLGGNFDVDVMLYNPDPIAVDGLYLHLWVGSGYIDQFLGTFLSNVDSRFPRLTEPSVPGLTLAAGSWTTLHFNFSVPVKIEKTKYIGNMCLMGIKYHGNGKYYDRSPFVFEVS